MAVFVYELIRPLYLRFVHRNRQTTKGEWIMSAKEKLYDLVDQLDDEQAIEVVAYLRRLLREPEMSEATAMARLTKRMWPQAVSGSTYFTQQQRDLTDLAAQQGVQPVMNFDDLLGDFWPEDETADDFIATVRQWRHEGGYA
jgi:hypothetical protein